MPFTVPVAQNYSKPLNAVPLDWLTPPNEGPKGIQCEIDWATDGGPNKTCYVNITQSGTLKFSKIRAIAFDNSGCGSDVKVIFPDTETTVTIPAYTPYSVIPVFTNQTQFYVQCLNEESEDVTNFMILNTLPPPVSVPVSSEQNFASSALIPISGASGLVQLVPNTVSGTLEAALITGSLFATAGGNSFSADLIDGTSKVLGVFGGSTNANQITNLTFLQLSGVAVRFQQGISLGFSSTGLSGSFANSNLFYRTP